MSGTPILDPRSREDILAQVVDHARSYTPEWRCDGAEDDPGAALAALFCDMFYQTVDRFNSVPGKLRTEFLNLTGFQMPDPSPAEGILQFAAHETADGPVPVPEGTQVFTRDEEDENVVYETERRIEATAARLTDIFYADARGGIIQRVDLSAGAQPFFTAGEGENLQRHRFSLAHGSVLSLCGPCEVEVELRRQADFLAAQTAALLAEKGAWTFRSGGEDVPFTSAAAEGAVLRLRYEGALPFTPDEEGRYAVSCSGDLGGGTVLLDGARLRSRPLGPLALDGAASGDVPLDLSRGGYCFGRRPAPYGLCYFRSDRALCKRGAAAVLRLEIAPEVTEPEESGPQYQFNRRIIDKRDAVAEPPDDVFVDQVVWEYFNGLGWRTLAVRGNENPFSCRDAGPQETVFDVPEDLQETEVNAVRGFYVRARVIRVENELSQRPRWIVPFLRGASCGWSYAEGRPAEWCRSENNGDTVEIADAQDREPLSFPAVVGLEDQPRSMYFCFDRSPNAMPLSILFDVAGQARMNDKLRFEAWDGKRFEPVRSVDLTRGLLHTGMMLLYLPRPLPERTLFGRSGCWLRLARSAYMDDPGGCPRVRSVRLNTVGAVQRQRAPDAVFSAGPYEAGKTLRLLRGPVLEAQVWVDELSAVGEAEAQALARQMPERVRLEWEDRVLTHCWVRWERAASLAAAGPEERCCCLDPYEQTVAFGDGRRGRVPPAGEENIRVTYWYGGGSRGNRPAGAVTDLIGGLPRISHVENLTAMSGGTDRFSTEKADAVGNRRLRNRDRAAGPRDFEELVLQNFPQVAHVRCFPDRDASGAYASGHVSVVVESGGQNDRRVADELCQRIYGDLSRRCDCVLAAEGRLHVTGSTVITVNSRVTVELEDLDRGADTQQEIARRLAELIDGRWRRRDIGDQLRISQVWQTVRDTPNVRLVRSILLEGCYDQGGVQRIAALEDDGAFPYATVESGEHLIQLE